MLKLAIFYMNIQESRPCGVG